jgi:ferrous iron transport protein A
MTPLYDAKIGETVIIRKVEGDDTACIHLAELGFIPNSAITVVNKIDGNLVLQVKGSRIAIGKQLASKVLF